MTTPSDTPTAAQEGGPCPCGCSSTSVVPVPTPPADAPAKVSQLDCRCGQADGDHYWTCPRYVAIPPADASEQRDDGYHVELGGQRFTQAQWEALQPYIEGRAHADSEDAATWSPPAEAPEQQDCIVAATRTNCHCSVPEGAGDLMAGPHHHVNCPMHRFGAPKQHHDERLAKAYDSIDVLIAHVCTLRAERDAALASRRPAVIDSLKEEQS